MLGCPARSSHIRAVNTALPMNVNIRTRLNVLVAVAILPLLALAGGFLWQRIAADYDIARAEAREAAQLSAARIDDYFEHMNGFLTTIGRMVSADPADIEKNDAFL